MRFALTSALLLLVAAPALANPMPAGKCSLLDDGISRTVPMALKKAVYPRVLSMVLPADLRRHDGAIFDIDFRIAADGSVSTLHVLCASVAGRGLETELVDVSRGWRFTSMMIGGKAVAARATYRIAAGSGDRIPLGFAVLGSELIPIN